MSDSQTENFALCTSEEIITSNAYIFYFDLIGVTEKFCKDQNKTLSAIRNFQRAARRSFPFTKDSYVVTLYDNVWCRVNATSSGAPWLLFNFASDVMLAAKQEGFDNYFGCITYGLHEYNPDDRMLIAGQDFEDLRVQHLDITSEPHIRSATSEKWAKDGNFPKNAVMVSEEALCNTDLSAWQCCGGSKFATVNGTYDLSDKFRNDKGWPFPKNSKFQAFTSRENL